MRRVGADHVHAWPGGVTGAVPAHDRGLGAFRHGSGGEDVADAEKFGGARPGPAVAEQAEPRQFRDGRRSPGPAGGAELRLNDAPVPRVAQPVQALQDRGDCVDVA